MHEIAGDYFVAPQISPDDVAAIASAGFVAIICNRPDGEDPGQPTATEIAARCKEAGLDFHHIPVSGMPLSATAVQEHRRIVEDSDGPVLGYCRSGQRSELIFAASA